MADKLLTAKDDLLYEKKYSSKVLWKLSYNTGALGSCTSLTEYVTKSDKNIVFDDEEL